MVAVTAQFFDKASRHNWLLPSIPATVLKFEDRDRFSEVLYSIDPEVEFEVNPVAMELIFFGEG